VIEKALAAFALFGTGKCAVATGLVSLNIAFH